MTVEAIVAYIVDNCPAQGDCSKCPTKQTCKAHELGKALFMLL